MKSSFRFLFLLYHYPPLPGISPKRNYQISTQLSKHSSFSLIFTAKTLNHRDKNNTESSVQRISTLDYRNAIRKKNISGAITEDRKKADWFQRVIKLMNTFPFSVLISEGGPVYLINVIIKGHKAIRKHKITHLYSSFRPFVDHFAAYILKSMNPNIVWVADFRDLMFDPYFNKIYFKKFHLKLFKTIFTKAEFLTTVSDGLAGQLKEYNQNVLTIRNGIQNIPNDLAAASNSSFSIAYTGSMYLDQKNATPLFTAIKELTDEGKIQREKVRVIYAGKDSFYWKEMAESFGLFSILDLRGQLSSDDAMAIQKNSCINLLLSISSDELTGIVTGKLIEYFEAGSPVLAIVKNQVDPELEMMLTEIQIGKSFSDRNSDLPGIKKFIYEEYQSWETTGMNRKPVDLKLLGEKYAVEKTMRPLFDCLGMNRIAEPLTLSSNG